MLVMSEKTNLFGQSGQHGGYRELFEKKSMDPGLEVCSLSQHPFKHATTSHADGSLPTFLASNYQFLWSMSRSRWLTSKEKWTAMGWPTTQKLATILGRPVVEPRLTKSAHQQIGNAMHVFNAGLIVMSVLGSIELIDIGVPKVPGQTLEEEDEMPRKRPKLQHQKVQKDPDDGKDKVAKAELKATSSKKDAKTKPKELGDQDQNAAKAAPMASSSRQDAKTMPKKLGDQDQMASKKDSDKGNAKAAKAPDGLGDEDQKAAKDADKNKEKARPKATSSKKDAKTMPKDLGDQDQKAAKAAPKGRSKKTVPKEPEDQAPEELGVEGQKAAKDADKTKEKAAPKASSKKQVAKTTPNEHEDKDQKAAKAASSGKQVAKTTLQEKHEDSPSDYESMTWRALYDLARERRVTGLKKQTGLSKDVLVGLLRAADGEKKHPSQTTSSSSKLADLLKAKEPAERAARWASEGQAGEQGENITQMFLDTSQAGMEQKQKINMEEASYDGILPSVAIDKFLQAIHVMEDKNLLGILFGREQQRFGKGKSAYNRNVVYGMVLGREAELSEDLLNNEAAESQQSILGIMFHEETNSEALARVTETLRRPDAGLLHAKIARPPAAADDFYKCSTFRVVSNDEPRDGTVFIAETGRLSNLKLRFIPDETVEREIREKNIGDCAVDETQRALEKLAAEQTKAKQVVEEKDKKRLQEEIKELGDRHQDLRAALEKVARLPFTAQATEETTACFQEIFEDFGIADLFGDEDELTTVSVLSKLGGANEQAKTEQEAKCKKVSELAIRLSGMRKTAQQKSQKAKERALSKLDEDDEKKKKDKRNKRRRHIWSLTVGRGKKKRIEDDFEGMKSKKEHRPKLTIQQRLDVVNWVLAKKKEIASDSPESKGTSEDEEVDEEEEEVEKGSCEQKVQKQSKRKRGRNLQRMAELQFPHLVGPWISVSRWVQRSKDQQWDNIPQHIREQHKEVPDVWKEAFGNTKKKGKPRFQSVPPEILKSLDEHMAILTSGVSQVTERNEEIMLWQIVDGLVFGMKHDYSPLGLNLPAGSMDEAEVRKFNSDHAGEAFAILSDSRSHFMTSACFTKMLYSLYGPAFDAQRKRYGLDGKSRGKFLADAWTGFRSNEGGEALERNVWSQLNGVELPSTRPGGWSAHGQPVDQLHNAYRRELMDVGAENLRYHSDMTQRPTFSQLQLGRSGTIKRQVSFDRQLLEDTLTAWRRIPLTHFSAAWSVCGYCSKEEAMDLQTAANMLDPSGMNAAWGAQDLALPVRGVRRLQWQVIKEDNTPAAMPNTLSNGEVAFQSGGEFFISGPNFAASEVRCVALEQTSDLPAAGAAPWRLDNYDFEDDEEQEDTEEEQDDDGEESAQADEELQPPSGWQAEMLPENGHVSSDDEPDEVYELWGGKIKSSKDLTSEQVPGVAKPDEADESQVAEGQVIHRPRGKMTSEEWMLLEKEGWVQKLPQVQDTTLGRHEKSSAWSAKYPHPHGQQQYVSRSFGSIRTPLQALLECMHWLEAVPEESEEIPKAVLQTREAVPEESEEIPKAVLQTRAASVQEAVPEESEEIPKAVLRTRACIFHSACRKDMVMNKCLASACHGLVVLEEEAELQSVAGLAEFQLIAVLQQMPGEPFASHAWCRRVPHCRLRVAAGGPLRCEKVLRRWPQLPRQFLAEAVSLGLYALSLRRFLRACARRPLRSWRANPRKVPEARLTRRRGRPTPWCSDGFIEAEEEPGQWLEQYTGEVYVQSLASMLPVEVLKSFMPSLSGAFLDLCSAPGSKASQLALKLHRAWPRWCMGVAGGLAGNKGV
ncbi:unnamed protein product, partial [Durusdinium trenchii]